MTGIVLSIILILGMAGGPTGDFNNTTATDGSVTTTTTQDTNTVKHRK
jgi:hypothetical protein